MTSLKVKTTLTPLFLLPASARLPEWKQLFVGLGNGCVLELCLYPQILDDFLPCFSDPPPMLVDSITSVLCNHQKFSPPKCLWGRTTDQLYFGRFKNFILFHFADFLEAPMGMQESVASCQNKINKSTLPPTLQGGALRCWENEGCWLKLTNPTCRKAFPLSTPSRSEPKPWQWQQKSLPAATNP